MNRTHLLRPRYDTDATRPLMAGLENLTAAPMPIWETANVEEQPSLIMDSWRVVEVIWPVVELAKAVARNEECVVQLLRKNHHVDLSNPSRPTSRHLVGYVQQNREGRHSTAIVEFDPVRLICRTSSGRTYGLVGAPRWNGDARYVMERWMDRFMITEWHDVTDEVLGSIAAPRPLDKTLH